MHQSAYDQMALCVKEYMPVAKRHRVLDLGSRVSPGQSLTHRGLLADHKIDYVGVDVLDGPNVDRVMKDPYRIPIRSGTADIVLSGQAFEHIPFFWASIMEIGRVLRPGGHAFITAPSRGNAHDSQDCWRYYPDGFRAMAAYCGLELREAFTDFPPLTGIRHDYQAIDAKHAYWGDSVGVFRKPRRAPHLSYRITRAVVREVTIGWANHIGGVEGIPAPGAIAGREFAGRPAQVPAPARATK